MYMSLFQQAFNKSRKTFKLKERVALIHAWITDTIFDEQKLPSCGRLLYISMLSVINPFCIGFILGTPHHIYRFLAASEEEKNSWFTTLHKMIFAQKQLFSKVSESAKHVKL